MLSKLAGQMLQTSLVLNMANILCEHWIAGARATDGCSVIFKWKLKTAFPNTNSDLTDCNLSGSNCTLENSVMTLKSHIQSGKSVFTSSNSWSPEVQPAIKLHDVLLSAFEAWENLPFLHKPLWLRTSQHPPIPAVERIMWALCHLLLSEPARFISKWSWKS